MHIEIPDDILRMAEAGERDVRVSLAVQFYADNRLDYAQAVRLAEVRPPQFDRELLARGLSVQRFGLEQLGRKAG